MLSSSVNAYVRKGRASDGEALAKVFSEAWRQTYCGIIPHSHLELIIDRRSPEWWRKAARCRHGMVTLHVDGDVVGYATYGNTRARGLRRGEIYELYVLPSYQGLGFGEYLFESCRNELDARKYRGLIVWVLAANTIATDFYWRRGGRPFAEVQDDVGGCSIAKIGFQWP